MEILPADLQGILALKPEDITRPLEPEEVVRIARTLGAFWTYDYAAAAKQGKVGLHALLKSGLHSDGFFISRILLAPENIRRIIAAQMVIKINEEFRRERTLLIPTFRSPDYVGGVPDGATKLGEDIAEMLNAKVLEMKKVDGKIVLLSSIDEEDNILLVEDFCTRGTGFVEAVKAIKQVEPYVNFFYCDPVIINRGGLQYVTVEGAGKFYILPVVDWRVQDWKPEECPLCKMG